MGDQVVTARTKVLAKPIAEKVPTAGLRVLELSGGMLVSNFVTTNTPFIRDQSANIQAMFEVGAGALVAILADNAGADELSWVGFGMAGSGGYKLVQSVMDMLTA